MEKSDDQCSEDNFRMDGCDHVVPGGTMQDPDHVAPGDTVQGPDHVTPGGTVQDSEHMAFDDTVQDSEHMAFDDTVQDLNMSPPEVQQRMAHVEGGNVVPKDQLSQTYPSGTEEELQLLQQQIQQVPDPANADPEQANQGEPNAEADAVSIESIQQLLRLPLTPERRQQIFKACCLLFMTCVQQFMQLMKKGGVLAGTLIDSNGKGKMPQLQAQLDAHFQKSLALRRHWERLELYLQQLRENNNLVNLCRTGKKVKGLEPPMSSPRSASHMNILRQQPMQPARLPPTVHSPQPNPSPSNQDLRTLYLQRLLRNNNLSNLYTSVRTQPPVSAPQSAMDPMPDALPVASINMQQQQLMQSASVAPTVDNPPLNPSSSTQDLQGFLSSVRELVMILEKLDSEAAVDATNHAPSAHSSTDEHPPDVDQDMRRSANS